MTMKVSCQKKYRILFTAKGALLLFKMLAEFLHIFARPRKSNGEIDPFRKSGK